MLSLDVQTGVISEENAHRQLKAVTVYVITALRGKIVANVSILVFTLNKKYIKDFNVMISMNFAGLCPAGFDPVGLAEKPNRRTVRMELGHMGGLMMGKYSFHFAGSEVYLPANANDNDEVKCNSALKGLASVSSATCKRESFNANTGTGMYLITLQGFPDKPYMNNVVHHNGNPAISLFACNVSKIDAEEARQPFCFLSDAEPLADFPRKCTVSVDAICWTRRTHGY